MPGELVEVVGRAVKAPPEQIGATELKVGVTLGFTVMIADPLIAALQFVER